MDGIRSQAASSRVISPRLRRVGAAHGERTDWRNLRRILPYLWEYRGRVLLALGCLIAAKLAVIGVPLVLKQIVDAFDTAQGRTLVLPVVFLLAYGALRMAASLFNELRDAVFARVRYRAMRRLSLKVLAHLHHLSLRFHLARETGAVFRDLERGTQSVATILNYLAFHILPVAAEFAFVALYLFGLYPARFGAAVFATVAIYVGFTVLFTNWRVRFRYRMNELDSRANQLAVDSVINYETVKYFNNEDLECRRYGEILKEWEQTAVMSQTTMSALNFGQGLIIAVGVTSVMFFAAAGVVAGDLTLGDLILVNTMMLQLFLPLGMLGVVYRALRYALADMDLIIRLLDQRQEVRDRAGAVEPDADARDVTFENVGFHYRPGREIIERADFAVPAGARVAVVGASGAGKSTLARLLFRFYDVQRGRIIVGGRDVRDYTQAGLRRLIGVVAQDTVLFNRSIYDNVLYGWPGAGREQVRAAVRVADLEDFIARLPDGYDTMVGERGLKLSGGERQKIAIARAVLKKPSILVFDEATASLDSRSERAILQALARASAGITTLIIAHRLSTVVNADLILVMEHGRIVERGTHAQLLAHGGLYRTFWELQQAERAQEGGRARG